MHNADADYVGMTTRPNVLSLLFCFYGFPLKKKTLKLVMKGIKLELWIASLTTWSFIIVQRSHGSLIVNKHYAIFKNLY